MANVRQANTATAASSPGTAAYGLNVRAGSALFLIVCSTAASPNVSSVSDTLTNTWAQSYSASIGSFKFEVWAAASPSGGANTVSVTYAAGTPSSQLWVVEGEALGTVTFDTGSSFDDTSAGSPLTLATLTTAGAAILFLAFRIDSGAAAPILRFEDTSGRAWAYMRGNDSTTYAAWRIVDVATSVAPTAPFTGSPSGESIVVAYAVTA